MPEGGDHVDTNRSAYHNTGRRSTLGRRRTRAGCVSRRVPIGGHPRKGYRRDLSCWLKFCAAPRAASVRRCPSHACRGVPASARAAGSGVGEVDAAAAGISTLSSWFTWLEDEEVNVGNPAGRVRRPRRHSRPQPGLDRNELTDLLAGGLGPERHRPGPATLAEHVATWRSMPSTLRCASSPRRIPVSASSMKMAWSRRETESLALTLVSR